MRSESGRSEFADVNEDRESAEDDLSPGRVAGDESYCPSNPSKAPRLDHLVKKGETEPTFATPTTVEREMLISQSEN